MKDQIGSDMLFSRCTVPFIKVIEKWIECSLRISFFERTQSVSRIQLIQCMDRKGVGLVEFPAAMKIAHHHGNVLELSCFSNLIYIFLSQLV